jgi:hypothetical protein
MAHMTAPLTELDQPLNGHAPRNLRPFVAPLQSRRISRDSAARRLPGFQRLATCRACLGEAIRIDYCRGDVKSTQCHDEGVLDEHFHRTCATCGNIWYEGLLSAAHDLA